jgi:ClpP class serine protease
MSEILDFIAGSNWLIEARYGQRSFTNFLMSQKVSEKERGDSKEANMASFYIEPSGQYNYSEAIQSGSIAYHKMQGVMISQDGACQYGMSSWATSFTSVDKNPQIKAHIIDVNSGGGEATAGVIMMSAIKSATKPVFIWGHTIASAAYLGVAHATEIWLSSELSFAGSIGAVIQFDTKMLKQMKKRSLALYSRKSQEKNIEYRELMEGNEEPYIDLVTKLDEGFMNIVAKARGLNKGSKQYKKATAGAMFQGREAVEIGLVDGIGDLETIIMRINKYT